MCEEALSKGLKKKETINIDLERSIYLNARRTHKNSLKVPKLSDARAILGKPLANVVFSECEPALKKDFGLEPPLNGAGEDLWTSPSDLLIGKVCLKPPLTSKHIQALTHQGILEIGQCIEKKFWNEMEVEKEKALNEQEELLLEQYSADLQRQIEKIVGEEKEKCTAQTEALQQAFEVRMIEDINELEDRMREEMKYQLQTCEQLVNEKWQRKLESETKNTIKNMAAQFMEDLTKQEEILRDNFLHEIRKHDMKNQFELEEERQRCAENLEQVRHNLECKNIANMMFILCTERKKCKEEKIAIQKSYNNKLENEKKKLAKKKSELASIIEEKNKLILEVSLRETCLLEVLRQFQKFINFALRASPTQAEFLLSIERMMVFELTNTIMRSSFKDTIPVEESKHWKAPASEKSSAKSLNVKEYHDCNNEVDPPSEFLMGSDEFLPGFYYKKNMYVREDFRDLISAGLKITPSNELWNRDVESFMKALQEPSVESKDSVLKRKGKHSETQKKRRKSKMGEMSSVHFNVQPGQERREDEDEVSILKDKRSIVGSTMLTKMASEYHMPSPPPTLADDEETDELSKPVPPDSYQLLIGARNSVELLREKLTSIKRKYLENDQDEEPDEDEGSEKLTEFENVSVIDSPPDADTALTVPESLQEPPMDTGLLVEKTSKLSVVVKDSVIIHRASIVKRRPSEVDELELGNKSPLPSLSKLEIERCKRLSRIDNHRDSLELLKDSKSMSFHSRAEKNPSKHSIEETLIGGHFASVVKLADDNEDKTIKLSHVEVYPIEKEETVSFGDIPVIVPAPLSDEPKIKQEIKIVPEVVKGKTVRRDRRSSDMRDNFLTKRNEIMVLGDMTADEHLQDQDTFTLHRIHSFIEMIKDHPNLMRTFTACTR